MDTKQQQETFQFNEDQLKRCSAANEAITKIHEQYNTTFLLQPTFVPTDDGLFKIGVRAGIVPLPEGSTLEEVPVLKEE